ncbi:MAG: RrF2 family transcriptional regulator [Phycisphaerales bacterium]
MKLLSDACEYGLRAVLWLAQRPGQAQKVREIAEGTKAAPGYLVKVLQSLTKAGILSAQRGSLGGFTLLRNPAELTVLDIINAIDPIERIETCPLGIEAHGECLCPMHKRIDDAFGLIEASFANSRIAELMERRTASDSLCAGLTLNGTALPTKEDS